MRQENEVIENILSVAKQDDAVRAVVRTNLVKREYIHSYEFYFIVNDTDKFEDDVFEKAFGERILLYRADKNYPGMFPDTKAHLMVFGDGITIVVNAIEIKAFLARYNRENVYENVWIGDTFKVILDKDNVLPEVERMEEMQTLFAGKPSEEEFLGTCNEFFWVLKTFSEYALRKELPAAMFYLNDPVRKMLNKMIRWHIYLKQGKPVDMGVLDANMEKMLEEEMFLLYKKTYPTAEPEQLWKAFDSAVELWHRTAVSVAGKCGFAYPEETEEKMLDFIQSNRNAEF
ncbi:MAG: aminoglycoside 6-adenylyltransferase [Saccharofermentans sp.]|nr:aminoglycoside 6-adenylyltransferase [Saccharofermentans sp.]